MHPLIAAATTLFLTGALLAAAPGGGAAAADAGAPPAGPPTGRSQAWLKEIHGRLEQRVTLDLERVGLEEALRALRERSGLTIVVSPAVAAGAQRVVTVQARDQCVREVLETLCQQAGLHHLVTNHALYIDSESFAGQPRGIVAEAGLEGALSRKLDQRLTLDLRDHDFADLLRTIGTQCGIIIVVSPPVAARRLPPVTVAATDERLRDVLDRVLPPLGLYVILNAQAVCVMSE